MTVDADPPPAGRSTRPWCRGSPARRRSRGCPAATRSRGGRRDRRGAVRRGGRYRPGARFGPAARPRRLAAAAPVQPRPRRRSRSPCSRWSTPVTSRATRSTSPRRSGRSRRAPRARSSAAPAAHHRRRPHDRAAAAARVPRSTARWRVRPLRRPPRHLGHLLRRRRTRTARRSGAPPRRACSIREGAPRRHPRAALRRAPTWPTTRARVHDHHVRRHRRPGIARRHRARARPGRGPPVYVSVDIDVLDPAHAPGTGTPEAGG